FHSEDASKPICFRLCRARSYVDVGDRVAGTPCKIMGNGSAKVFLLCFPGCFFTDKFPSAFEVHVLRLAGRVDSCPGRVPAVDDIYRANKAVRNRKSMRCGLPAWPRHPDTAGCFV